MESSVAALLLVTASVVLACVAVIYAVDTAQASFSSDSPANQLINRIQQNLLNETSILNGTLPLDPTPTPTPTAQP